MATLNITSNGLSADDALALDHVSDADIRPTAVEALLGHLCAAIARTVQDCLKGGVKRDSMVGLAAVTPTP